MGFSQCIINQFLACTLRLLSQSWYPAQVQGILFGNGVALYMVRFQKEQVTHILDPAVRVNVLRRLP